jgi:hypothetical protein
MISEQMRWPIATGRAAPGRRVAAAAVAGRKPSAANIEIIPLIRCGLEQNRGQTPPGGGCAQTEKWDPPKFGTRCRRAGDIRERNIRLVLCEAPAGARQAADDAVSVFGMACVESAGR